MSSSHYLSNLFNPSSIAVIGASERLGSLGTRVFENLLAMPFDGNIYPVNPKYGHLKNMKCYRSLSQIKAPVELAIIATPEKAVPEILEACGEKSIGAAVLLSGGFRGREDRDADLEKKIADAAERNGIRFLGPHCLGLVRPHVNLNASTMIPVLKPGKLALVSQSGALCAAMLDWAQAQEIGFSAVVSTGVASDIDFGEVMDFLATDPKTHSILLYIEGIRDARAFMTGLRAVARAKPVTVVKVGRHHRDDHTFHVSHTGAMVGSDQVFDAALRRAGVVRGKNLGDLFSVASVLARGIRVQQNNLAIICNGVGPGMMASDRAYDLGVKLATFSEETRKALESVTTAEGNPVNLGSSAGESLFQEALNVVLKEKAVSGVLVLLTPHPRIDPVAIAREVVNVVKTARKPVLTSWMGDAVVEDGRKILREAGIPSFRLPENAVQAFAYLADFYHNQKLLIQTPGPLAETTQPDIPLVNQIIDSSLQEPRSLLTEVESKQVLAAFHIPVVKTGIAHNSNEAIQLAQKFGFPVVLKIYSKKITHKSDVGGVRLGIENIGELLVAYEEIMHDAETFAPGDAEGVVVEPMINFQHGRELLVGIVRDPVFGPVISFGSGGVTAELLADNSVALPPLNHLLVEELISRTRAEKLLGKMRNIPEANRDTVINILLRVSEIACEVPAIKELDINPLMVDERQAIVVDARIVVDEKCFDQRYGHTAIHPYPSYLTYHESFSDGLPYVIRPIRPEDAEIEKQFVDSLSDQAKFYRFMHTFKEITPEMLAQFTLIDYEREMAFVAVVWQGTPEEEEIAVCRYVTNHDLSSCEFAIVVGDHWQRRGLAKKLMMKLIDHAKYRGLKSMEGDVLAENQGMISLTHHLGFVLHRSMEDASVVRVVKDLTVS